MSKEPKTAEQIKPDSKCPSCGKKIYCLVCGFYVDCPECKTNIRQQALIEGITIYAWWKDGVQYVGTTGRTLKEAIAEIIGKFNV